MKTIAKPPVKPIDWAKQTDGTALIKDDPWLEPYADKLRARHAQYLKAKSQFDSHGGLLGQISQGHTYFGFTRGELWKKPGVWYREWAPNALQLRLIGDFNNWDRMATPLVRDTFGVWSIFLPDDQYKDKLKHNSRVKVHVITETTPNGSYTGVYQARSAAAGFKGIRRHLLEPPDAVPMEARRAENFAWTAHL